MSVMADSPGHSSSTDDFIACLNAELDSFDSSNSSSDKEAENQDGFESDRRKFQSMEENEMSNSEEEKERPTSEVTIVAESSVKVDSCNHPGTFGGMCFSCGQKLNVEFGVTFRYIHKNLRLHDEEISRLRNIDMKALLCRKKLYLVLDLDQTLLNSKHLKGLSSKEEYLLDQTDSLEDIPKGSLFKLEYVGMMTKLRPFVRSFLKEASEMFEMYIYTMGNRPYALEMAKLLDPQKEYFNDKVISQEDFTNKDQKDLDIMLGKESAILILDDTEHVWTKHKDNLILMERYIFFAPSRQQVDFNSESHAELKRDKNSKPLAELKRDENETDGALAKILKVLKQIHHIFFDKLEDLVDRDVRQVLSLVRSRVLSGCLICFDAEQSLRKIAEQMGAICLTEIDPAVTHVVAIDAGSEKSHWAMKEKKFLVHPRWIKAASYLWEKQPEDNFVVKLKKHRSRKEL